MRTYTLDQRGTTPLYAYLYQCIRTEILNGTLSTGERLPSKRRLAEHLRVSVTTIEGAYAQLEAEGYLYTKPKRGFFVAPVEQIQTVNPANPTQDPAAISIDLSCDPAQKQAREWRLDLKSSHVDVSRFPLSIWAKLTRQVLSESGAEILRPIPHQGLPALRQAIAEQLREFKGMTVYPEQILIGAGAEYLYLLLAQLLTGCVQKNPKQETIFALEDPGYLKIRQVYQKCGICCRPVSFDPQGLRLDILENSGAIAAHISPSHHYPTGFITPIGRRQALLRWADRQNSFLIEDDYDSEFRFTGRPIPTLQSIDHHDRVIYMNTFSQTISPSIRIGFLVLPPRLLERYWQDLSFYTCPVPALEQYVLAKFLSGGYYEQHLARMRNEYRSRRTKVLEIFRALPGQVSEQGAGLHFLFHLNTRCSDTELRARAEQSGIRLGFLSEYAALPNPAYHHTLVINYAGLKAKQIPEAAALLQELLSD